MKQGKLLHIVTFSLLLVGGVNWGLVGLFNFNLVEVLLGAWPSAVQIVYGLVGVSAVYIMFTHAADCKICGKK
jgi:uncharacterized protein